MKRHYYISDDLDDLETLEQELEASGISTEQIHVLSDQDAHVEQRRLHDVASVLKQDVVHSASIGVAVGGVLAFLVLGGAYLVGWTQSAAGWTPIIFLAIVVFGFCAWEGGLFGIQVPNTQFRRFKQMLAEGKHVFFVDVEPSQEVLLERAVQRHPLLSVAGIDSAAPYWMVAWLQRWHQFKRTI